MAKQQTGLIVRRNTAVALQSVVEAPAIALLVDTVPIGSSLLGFDPEAPDGEKLLYQMDDNPTREPNQHTTEPFHVVTWGVKKVAVRDGQSGEMLPAVRTVLFDPDCETLAFVSQGALLSLDMLRTRYGDGPYQPPIPCVIKEVKTRAGWRIYKIVPISALRDNNKK
jgi:hypothetical protein